MSNMLKKSEQLRDASTGKPVSILELLGDGGQGEVYRVSLVARSSRRNGISHQ